jgi:hypothetical protein
MMLFRSPFLAATAMSFGLAASHDRLLQLESCDSGYVTLSFNFKIELDISEGCEGDDLVAIGSFIQRTIDFITGYIPENKNEFIEAYVCPAPNLVYPEDRFLQQVKTARYAYSGGARCARCRSNMRVYAATVSNGGRRTLKGTTKEKITESKSEVRKVDMEKQEKKLQSEVEALNQLKLEKQKLKEIIDEMEDKDGQLDANIFMEADEALKDAKQTLKDDLHPIQNMTDKELDRPKNEMKKLDANITETKDKGGGNRNPKMPRKGRTRTTKSKSRYSWRPTKH